MSSLDEVQNEHVFDTSEEFLDEDAEDTKETIIDAYLKQNDVFHTNTVEQYDRLDRSGFNDVALTYLYKKSYQMVSLVIAVGERRDEDEEVLNQFRSVKNEMEDILHPEKLSNKDYRKMSERLCRTPQELKRKIKGKRTFMRNNVNLVFSGTEITSETKTEDDSMEGF